MTSFLFKKETKSYCQMVRHEVLIPVFAGSSPASPVWKVFSWLLVTEAGVRPLSTLNGQGKATESLRRVFREDGQCGVTRN